jgi:uncharacterized protein YegP (UPF0339 family)
VLLLFLRFRDSKIATVARAPLGREAQRGRTMKFEIYVDASGQYRWRLRASNGQIVASSGESFASKANARAAAENVKARAGSASIVEV